MEEKPAVFSQLHDLWHQGERLFRRAETLTGVVFQLHHDSLKIYPVKGRVDVDEERYVFNT